MYETLAQPQIFLMVILFGFLSGIIFDFANFFVQLCDKNKVVKFITDFLATVLCFVVFFAVILKFSYGEIRLWQILFFVASLLIQRATIGKLVAKGIELCYNFFIKILKKFLRLFSKQKSEINDKNSY